MSTTTAWASGLVITTSGLRRGVKQQVQAEVEAARGRYTPNLSPSCTHVVVDAMEAAENPHGGSGRPPPSEKLRVLASDRSTWRQEVVSLEWLLACRQAGRKVDEAPHRQIALAAVGPAKLTPCSQPRSGGELDPAGRSQALPAGQRCVLQPTQPSTAQQQSSQHPWVWESQGSVSISCSTGSRQPAAGASRPPAAPVAVAAAAATASSAVRPASGGGGAGAAARRHAAERPEHHAAVEAAPQSPPKPALTARPAEVNAPSPWRVGFSQQDPDFGPTGHAADEAPARALPWHVHMSQLPEDGPCELHVGDGDRWAGPQQQVPEADDEEGSQAALRGHGVPAWRQAAVPWHLCTSQIPDDVVLSPAGQGNQAAAQVPGAWHLTFSSADAEPLLQQRQHAPAAGAWHLHHSLTPTQGPELLQCLQDQGQPPAKPWHLPHAQTPVEVPAGPGSSGGGEALLPEAAAAPWCLSLTPSEPALHAVSAGLQHNAPRQPPLQLQQPDEDLMACSPLPPLQPTALARAWALRPVPATLPTAAVPVQPDAGAALHAWGQRGEGQTMRAAGEQAEFANGAKQMQAEGQFAAASVRAWHLAQPIGDTVPEEQQQQQQQQDGWGEHQAATAAAWHLPFSQTPDDVAGGQCGERRPQPAAGQWRVQFSQHQGSQLQPQSSQLQPPQLHSRRPWLHEHSARPGSRGGKGRAHAQGDQALPIRNEATSQAAAGCDAMDVEEGSQAGSGVSASPRDNMVAGRGHSLGASRPHPESLELNPVAAPRSPRSGSPPASAPDPPPLAPGHASHEELPGLTAPSFGSVLVKQPSPVPASSSLLPAEALVRQLMLLRQQEQQQREQQRQLEQSGGNQQGWEASCPSEDLTQPSSSGGNGRQFWMDDVTQLSDGGAGTPGALSEQEQQQQQQAGQVGRRAEAGRFEGSLCFAPSASGWGAEGRGPGADQGGEGCVPVAQLMRELSLLRQQQQESRQQEQQEQQQRRQGEQQQEEQQQPDAQQLPQRQQQQQPRAAGPAAQGDKRQPQHQPPPFPGRRVVQAWQLQQPASQLHQDEPAGPGQHAAPPSMRRDLSSTARGRGMVHPASATQHEVLPSTDEDSSCGGTCSQPGRHGGQRPSVVEHEMLLSSGDDGSGDDMPVSAAKGQVVARPQSAVEHEVLPSSGRDSGGDDEHPSGAAGQGRTQPSANVGQEVLPSSGDNSDGDSDVTCPSSSASQDLVQAFSAAAKHEVLPSSGNDGGGGCLPPAVHGVTMRPSAAEHDVLPSSGDDDSGSDGQDDSRSLPSEGHNIHTVTAAGHEILSSTDDGGGSSGDDTCSPSVHHDATSPPDVGVAGGGPSGLPKGGYGKGSSLPQRVSTAARRSDGCDGDGEFSGRDDRGSGLVAAGSVSDERAKGSGSRAAAAANNLSAGSGWVGTDAGADVMDAAHSDDQGCRPPAGDVATEASPAWVGGDKLSQIIHGLCSTSALVGLDADLDQCEAAGPAAEQDGASTAAQLQKLLEAAGARAVRLREGQLGSGVACVVCRPERAHVWLRLSCHVLSDASVLRCLTGRRPAPKLLHLSSDICRHLSQQPQAAGQRADPAAASKSPLQPRLPAPWPPFPPAAPGLGASAVGSLLASAPGRRHLVLKVKESEAAAGTGNLLQAAAFAPVSLLEDVAWNVMTEPGPSTVHWGGGGPPAAMEGMSPLPYSQAPYLQASPARQTLGLDDGSPLAATPSALDEPLLRARAVTLLLPRDEHGALGRAIIHVTSDDGEDTGAQRLWQGKQRQRGRRTRAEVTVGQVLRAIHAWYAAEMAGDEQLAAIQQDRRVRRALQASFLSMRPVARGELLGPRCCWSGLSRCSRDQGVAVYELMLAK